MFNNVLLYQDSTAPEEEQFHDVFKKILPQIASAICMDQIALLQKQQKDFIIKIYIHVHIGIIYS